MVAKSKYVGKDFKFIYGDFKGYETRCTGVFTSENDGITYLELTNGMPVPVDKVDMYLKETKVHMNGDTIELDEYKEQTLATEKKEGFAPSNATSLNIQAPQQQAILPQNIVQQPQPLVDMFGGFSKNPMELSMKVNVELPDLSLIKVMYNNYGNKEEFISNFASYILASINKDVISASVVSLLEGNGKAKKLKKNNSPETSGEQYNPPYNNERETEQQA